jgi:hypothetical protein
MSLRPRRLFLDTNAVDALASDERLRGQLDCAARAGVVEVLITHLQIDEILEMPGTKVDAQAALLQTLAELDAARVPTAGAVWDRSRWEEASVKSEAGRRCSSHSEVATFGTPRTCSSS